MEPTRGPGEDHAVTIRTVLFDAGETLVYPHPSFPELFAEVLRSHGQEVDPVRVQEVVSVYSQRFAENARKGRQQLWSTSKEASRLFWLAVYRMFLEDVGITDDHEPIAEELYEAFSDPSKYRVHEDAVPALERLRSAGVTLGLVSNFESWLADLLESLGIASYFPVQVISGIEGVEKPDPKIFEIALERTGTAAQDAAYVGDHPMFDAEAAANAGLVAVLVDRRDRYPDTEFIRVRSLEEVPDALQIATATPRLDT